MSKHVSHVACVLGGKNRSVFRITSTHLKRNWSTTLRCAALSDNTRSRAFSRSRVAKIEPEEIGCAARHSTPPTLCHTCKERSYFTDCESQRSLGKPRGKELL